MTDDPKFYRGRAHTAALNPFASDSFDPGEFDPGCVWTLDEALLRWHYILILGHLIAVYVEIKEAWWDAPEWKRKESRERRGRCRRK